LPSPSIVYLQVLLFSLSKFIFPEPDPANKSGERYLIINDAEKELFGKEKMYKDGRNRLFRSD
jgi:hypothetical protein